MITMQTPAAPPVFLSQIHKAAATVAIKFTQLSSRPRRRAVPQSIIKQEHHRCLWRKSTTSNKRPIKMRHTVRLAAINLQAGTRCQPWQMLLHLRRMLRRTNGQLKPSNDTRRCIGGARALAPRPSYNCSSQQTQKRKVSNIHIKINQYRGSSLIFEKICY